ncbi:PREDICTED: probable glycosyltransferase At5g20260 [Tarenaya hassleriana]|uniref:probable glycosyltransferase At5g20260 n=1 Tax=Tarenaya hassleriana TaxID=28532 RepID=UPI00053C7B9C|nr:PREDICTED: probable glycosyltransferase At5g20260 [Tarenaya hassleriana]
MTKSHFVCIKLSLGPLLLVALVVLYCAYGNQNLILFSSFIPISYPSPSPSLSPLASLIPTPTPIPTLETRFGLINITTVSNHQKGENGKKIGRIEEELGEARAMIREAVETKKYASDKGGSLVPRGAVYRNPFAFHRSQKEMEKRFKVWVYKEGEPPLVHLGPLNNIYGIEGQFMDELHSHMSRYLAARPEEAHAFFIPVSVANIVHYLYRPLVTYSREQLQHVILDYIDTVSTKYPFWNRTDGADHFLVSCHDWAPDVSVADPERTKNLIRVLCNANTSEGFEPRRDVPIPEINIPPGQLGPPRLSLPVRDRNIFAFFAGGSHGQIRKTLLQHWKDKDDEIQVHEYLPKGLDYYNLMSRTMFCLCPSGYEVASPRVVAAINLGCVPVIISDHYALPFSDVLDWSKFTIQIPSEKIPEMKRILKRVSRKRYMVLQKRVLQVQRHFALNRPSKPYDMLHMLLHSVWLRRLNLRFSS